MTLEPGQKLGPYEMLAPLGAGGMGEVWRARDTRLERDVAIKVLPEALAHDEELRQRFEREARTVSQLNHPHICTLHDVGQEDERHYLVMELLEGESLADRLKRGALPPHEVLRFGAQIARALDAAHRSGITHRDVKPGNVMLTRSGAKLLDFGLAKASADATAAISSFTSVPTEGKPLTERGTILGTFQYMAPEQLEGEEADARTDIFALGALLYEMATGARAFQGATKTSLIAAIVSSQPTPVSSIQPMMPPALDHVIGRCLEKDPEDRWHSAHDVASELDWIGEAGSQAGVAATVVMRRKTRERVAWALAAAGLVATIVALAWAVSTRRVLEEASRSFRAELIPPEGFVIAPVVYGAISISPDGSQIILIGRESGFGLLVRDLETGEATALEGTENAIFPFWSPDGTRIGFFADGKLKKIDADGGPIQVLADAPAGRGGTWSREDLIVFAPDIQGPLMSVPAGGGPATAVTTVPEGAWTHRNPHVLPDGRHVLYSSREIFGQRFGSIAMSPIEGGEETLLVESASNPQYARGHLFWVRDRNLLAQPFDARSTELSGSPSPLADGVEYYNPRDIGNYSVSPGTLAWRRATSTLRRLVRLDQGGRETEAFGEPGLYVLLDVDRAGRRALLARRDSSRGSRDLWVMDLQRDQVTRATFTSSEVDIRGVFSPDGTRIAFSGLGGESLAQVVLWIQSTSGGRAEQLVAESPNFLVTQWSSDGKHIVGTVQETDTAHDIAYLALDDPTTIQKFAATPFEERAAQISPDGRWITWLSNESGQREVYMSDFPEAKQKWQVSKGGVARFPARWARTGDAVYYLTSEGIIRVTVSVDGTDLELGASEVMMEVDPSTFSAFFLLPDAQLLAMKNVADGGVEPLRIIRNWEKILHEDD